MKKRTIIFIGLIYSFIVSTLLMSIYVKVEYNLNVFEYIYKSSPITQKDKNILKNHGKIVYGSDQTSPPLRYKDIDDGQYKGLIVDLITSLSIQIGQEISFEPNYWWKDSLNSLSNNRIDFFDLIRSKERSEKFIFTDPLYTLSGNILKSNKSTNINSYQDLKGKKVAIIEGDYAIEFLKSKNIELNVLLTPDIETGVKKLINGEVEAVVGDEPVLKFYIKNLRLNKTYSILEEPIYTEKAVLAIPKDKEYLVDIINKGIFQLQKNGVYDSLKEKWYYEYDNIDATFYDSQIGHTIYILVGFIFISIYVFYGCTYILKREIKMKTEVIIESNKALELTQAQMIRDQKMVAIGHLASGVAHEIRNPLGIIRNYCYLIKEEDTTIEEAKEYTINIENNVQRASNIVSNLLNFARVSNGCMKELNIKEVIENIIKLEYELLSLKNIEVIINCEENLVCLINEESMKHIFLNLISNSVYAMEDKGCIHINAHIESNKLIISFKDNGVGIEDKNLKNIFNPFYTTKPIGKGTGLGLYITYNEIKNCKGTIDVKSTKGKGTCFTIKLPIIEEK